MAKRKARVAPPPKPGEWDFRFASSDAADGWEELCRQAPGPTRAAWDAIVSDPRDRTQPHRQHRLRGALGTRSVGGRDLEQWQYEVTGAGRVWYCPDDRAKLVWLTHAGTGHPKQTEGRR